MFFKRPKETLGSNFKTPPWFQVLVLLFIGAAVINQVINKDTPLATPATPEKTPPASTLGGLTEGIDNPFNNFSDALFPSVPESIQIQAEAAGSGAKAICGSTASLRYETRFIATKPEESTVADSNKTAKMPLTFRIGAKEVMPALEQAAEQMRVGGKRGILAAPTLAYGLEKFARKEIPPTASTLMEVELVEVKDPAPEVKAGEMDLRVTDTKPASGWYASCGDKVEVALTLWNREGRKLFDSTENPDKKAVSFTLGAAEVPLGLEQGVLGMKFDAARTLIVPPVYGKPLRAGVTSALGVTLPENEVLVMDVTLLRPKTPPQAAKPSISLTLEPVKENEKK